MKLEERFSKQFEELFALGAEVLESQKPLPKNVIGDSRVDKVLSNEWVTSVQNLLLRLCGENSPHYKNFTQRCNTRHHGVSQIREGLGILKSAHRDYQNGMLYEIRRFVEADIFDGLLEQVEHLHTNGYYQAGAVVAGCLLEDKLRSLCIQDDISLENRPKLDKMNADLTKAGILTKLEQKKITAVAHIRNDAAHGHWDKFTKEDVEDMLQQIRAFIENHN